MRRLIRWAAGGLAAAVVLAVFLAALAAKERDDRFCVACHLHEAKLARVVAGPATDLAGAHHRAEARVGCIGCHGGADPGMRLRVWAVAGWDTVKFLVGAYEEPTRMRLPLRDADCRVCHTPILRTAAPAAPLPPAPAGPPASAEPGASYMEEPPVQPSGRLSYHGFRGHDGVDVRCVACHTAHTTEAGPAEQFLSPRVVQPICRECHRQL